MDALNPVIDISGLGLQSAQVQGYGAKYFRLPWSETVFNVHMLPQNCTPAVHTQDLFLA